MRNLQILAVAAALSMTAAVSEAQQPARPERPTLPPAAQRPQAPAGPAQSSPGFGPLLTSERPDARETRDRLNEIFNQHPPSVREVLRIDPTLMYRADYIGNYPHLAAFLEQHPEVAHNPGFFIGERNYRDEPNSPRLEAARALHNMIEFAGTTVIIITITAGIIFLVKTVVEHRRWQRALKAQSELNTKLIDRFASSEDLLAYLQSPQGKALTGAPALPQPAARAMDAPLSRIFWSLQAGAVLAFAGIGLVFVSSRMTGDVMELKPVLFAFGTVVLTIGIGFLVSSIISFLLSQRLGLVRPLSARYTGEAPGS
jgi:hypothetical protein